MGARLCSFSGCGRPAQLRGGTVLLCDTHDMQRRRSGRLKQIGPRPIKTHPTDPTLALVELTLGYWAVISAVDVPAVSVFSWHAVVRPTQVYAARGCYKGGERYLHRFVARMAGIKLPKNYEIDHENVNGLDCRRSNLRKATKSQNQWNRGSQRSQSGVKGVYRERRTDRWFVQLQVSRTRYYGGTFATKEEAARAAQALRDRLHGEFANHGSVH